MTGPEPTLSIAAVTRDFPCFRVAYVLLAGLDPDRLDPARLDAFVRQSEAIARRHLEGREMAEIPEMRDWRAAYRAFGSKKTSYRNACEALLRRLRQDGQGLPRVSPLVDLYNALSVRCLMPVGADDLARVAPPSAFRFAVEGDSFLDLARDPPADDPPFAGEVVYADSEKCLCRRWNWRQDARSRIRADTRDAVVVIQSLDGGPGVMEAAAETFAAAATDALGAKVRWAIADRDRPVAVLTRISHREGVGTGVF